MPVPNLIIITTMPDYVITIIGNSLFDADFDTLPPEIQKIYIKAHQKRHDTSWPRMGLRIDDCGAAFALLATTIEDG